MSNDISAQIATKTNEELLSDLRRQVETNKEEMLKMKETVDSLSSSNLRYKRLFESINKDKVATITLPKNGVPKVDLEGPWVNGDFRRIQPPFFAALRLHKAGQKKAMQAKQSYSTGRQYNVNEQTRSIEPIELTVAAGNTTKRAETKHEISADPKMAASKKTN